MKGTMTKNYEAHKAYGTSSHEKITIIKKTPKQKKRLAKLKEKLKVADRKSVIAEKKLDSFRDKHSKVIKEYNNLELDVSDKSAKWNDIYEDINEYENKFIKTTNEWVD